MKIVRECEAFFSFNFSPSSAENQRNIVDGPQYFFREIKIKCDLDETRLETWVWLENGDSKTVVHGILNAISLEKYY